ncbi:MAG TPA: DNA-processing protein DprA [Casimicrobiaceae bacterium]|nr:DNA-processing protein DprA [Casimicrobiaceae bacterium]
MRPSARVDAWVRLSLAQVDPLALAALLKAFGSPQAVFHATAAQLTSATSAETARRLLAPGEGAVLDATRHWLEEEGHELIAWDDEDYPRNLLQIGDAPPVLYYLGRRELLNRPTLAIVGSRHATPQGIENAREFAAALSRAGLTIVSGLALGIDGAAHRGALEGEGSTLACVGTGLDRVYPAAHRDLAREIALRGGVLSEFPPGTPPLKHHFPRRNRLISGLASGVLIVEATLSSGSLITARCALEQNREVFAIPGSIHSPFSKGCHRLIRDGAKLVETAQDVLDELRIEGLRPAPAATMSEEPQQPSHRVVVGALGGDPCDLDTLIARTHLGADALTAALVELEIEGHVAALPGGRWQRLA